MNQPLIDPAEKKGKDEKMASLDVGSEIPLIDASPTSVSQNRLSMNDLKNNSRDYCKRFSEEVTQELVLHRDRFKSDRSTRDQKLEPE